MNYDEFCQVKKSLKITNETASGLMMCGVVGDNSTRYVLESKAGIDIENSYNGIFSNAQHTAKDFVWLKHGSIRTFGDFEGGGHPALTRGALPKCAGRIEADFFFYHSGHFHPGKCEAICHFVDFVECSVANLSGGDRDNEVEKLCAMTLRLYRKNSASDTYDVQFDDPGFHSSLEATGKEGRPYRGGYSAENARRARMPIVFTSSDDEDSVGSPRSTHNGNDLIFALVAIWMVFQGFSTILAVGMARGRENSRNCRSFGSGPAIIYVSLGKPSK